ncbi:hypothetical protein [Pseudaquabacterium pictum]|uniref:Uncharacterized protein n=1 Tax=Pseudaquabacterium pictum TaxID=2315236 RepID=A0A480AV79_9BURK|nr:hypothetical protein [Rubrivivax pictus]GCL65414.1 hypothetical protein AQPW35_44950 [Rubrivivax pictus]
MKTYDIEIRRVKSMHQGHGLVYMRLDAAVQPQPRHRDDDGTLEPSTVLKLTEENARVLFLLLKQQLADFDKKKPKSRF